MSKVIAERYQVLQLLGKGGMADVYLALDTLLDREVAIKLLKSDLNGDYTSIERFKREAEAVAKLAHPNIVDIYDVGEYNGSYYIVMEYVKGPTLKNLIKKRGAIEPKEAVFLLKQLCSAIKTAHDKGVIHRDIKSQNIIIKDDGTLKVLDFGIALAHDAIQITSDDIVLGSVHYLAPELSKGESATVYSDIYAMGIILYELLTGDVPFKGDQAIQIAIEHVKGTIPPARNFNPAIPQSVDNIIARATAKSPLDRYQSADEMLSDLKVCFSAEHANDKPIVIKNRFSQNDDESTNEIENTGTIRKRRIRKGTNFLLIIVVSIITILLAALITFVLYMSGVFKKEEVLIPVPDITGMTVNEAESYLNNFNLVLDKSNIQRVLTEDIEKGLIVSLEPNADTEVQKGTKIYITVSEGVYAVMKNYVGSNIQDVKAEISRLYEHVTVDAEAITPEEDSNKEPGTILTQEILEPGATFNPNISNRIKLTYVMLASVQVDPATIGMDIGEAVKYYESLGITVRIERLDTDDLSEDELAEIGENTVVKTEPGIGYTYTQKDGNSLVLYTY